MTHVSAIELSLLSASDMVQVTGGTVPNVSTSFANDAAYVIGTAYYFWKGVAEGFFG